MINISPNGITVFRDAMTAKVSELRLHTEAGELTGHGYVPIRVHAAKWEDGMYPDQTWEFTADDPVNVVGYYTTDARGKILYSEEFKNADGPAPMQIKNNGDRITVSMRLNLLG